MKKAHESVLKIALIVLIVFVVFNLAYAAYNLIPYVHGKMIAESDCFYVEKRIKSNPKFVNTKVSYSDSLWRTYYIEFVRGVYPFLPQNHDEKVLPIFLAVNNHEILTLLLENGANPNVEHGGDTPLHFAVKTSDIDAVNILLKYGADPNYLAKKYDKKITLLDIAIKNNIRLNERIKELKRKNPDSMTVFMYLTLELEFNSREIIKVLKEHGVKESDHEDLL